MKAAENSGTIFSLNGIWKFRLDPCEKGLDEKWYTTPDIFDREITVPGAIQAQDAAYKTRYDSKRTATAYESFDEIDFDYPVTRSEYRGTAWYTREFTSPEFNSGKKLLLCLDAVHPSAVVFIDDKKAGEHTSGPLEPCRLDITSLVVPGKAQRITVMITEEGRLLQGVVKWPYFSGIYRGAYLEITEQARIDNLFVSGDIHTGTAKINVTVSDCPENASLYLSFSDADKKIISGSAIICEAGKTEYEVEILISEHKLWSPDSPYLYTCDIQLIACGAIADEKTARFGFRSFSRNGRQLLLNNKPLFLRGTGFAGISGFPAPGADSDDWYKKLVSRVKEYGFNYLRWHTFSMEQILLDTADEMGVMIQSELYSVFYETEEERAVTAEQCRLMLLRNRNHPSVACFTMGNEHDGTDPLYISFRDSLCIMANKLSPDTLVMDSDGIYSSLDVNHGHSDIASSGIGVSIGNIFDMSPVISNMVNKTPKPYMVHEFGYPESFPQTSDISKYTGALRPFWLEHTLASAVKRGAEDLLPVFTENSRKVHFKVVKKAIEDARKVDGLAGYGHWGFHDFVHESIGLVDLFLEDKGGSAEEFKKVNGEIIIAMTPLCDRFTCYQDEEYKFKLFISNHTGNPLYGERLEWELVSGDYIYDKSERVISAGAFGVTEAGVFSVSGPDTGKPYSAVLKASLKHRGISNEWKLWFFPRIKNAHYDTPVCLFKDGWQTMNRMRSFCPGFKAVTEAALWETDADVLLVTPLITDAVSDFIGRGGRVLLLPTYYVNRDPGLPMQPSSFGPMPSFAGTVGGCGTVISSHPVLEDFPHEGWCDYQWFDLTGGERDPHVCVPFHHSTPSVYDLDKWQADIKPIIRSIPNWKKCGNRAYLFEVSIGNGRLLASSMRIFETMFTNPESAWLLDSLLTYASGTSFIPEASVSLEQFNRIRTKTYLTSL